MNCPQSGLSRQGVERSAVSMSPTLLALLPGLLLGHRVAGAWPEGGVARFEEYYACYYNQYFNLTAGAVAGPRRAKFVRSLLGAARAKGEEPPSRACVAWMCDPGLVWRRSEAAGVQVWAYFSLQGAAIASWPACYADQQGEFLASNYTVAGVGVHAMLALASGGTRLFYVPSPTCYRSGEELVEEVVDVLVGGRGSLEALQARYCRNTTMGAAGENVTAQPKHHNVSMVVLLDRFCELLQLRELECSLELSVLLFYLMLALLLINLCCLCCIFRRRLLARILLCWDMETAVTHTVKEGGQVHGTPKQMATFGMSSKNWLQLWQALFPRVTLWRPTRPV